MAVNLRDVAKRAGVSVPTASRVLSGSDYPVLPELRRRVEAAAQELDYVPNAQAQGLLRGSAGTIGVLAGDVGDPYFSEIVNGIHAVATERQLLVTICHTERDPERELAYFRMLQSHRASVVIVAGSGLQDERYREGMAARARSFRANGGRVVAIGTPVIDVDRVLVDNEAGGRALAEHLVGLGHRTVGVLAGPANVGSTAERVGGLRAVVEAAGGRVRVRHGAPTRDDAYTGARELLAAHPDVTAVVGSADQLAIGAMAYLHDHGRAVPGDVSVAGFNDIAVAADLRPPLTTVRLPLREMGGAALEVALAPAPEDAPVVRSFGVELVVRGSTAPVRPE
ncbi:MAG TPA: LacI family DNA-binding transcriptional regulator [Phototrophicaceae bacterium]|uniref:LacI family DNA-binding transcriptional regulator n=1 Tax=uncultured Georgenia sp. TaxID=378209 RepID=UPI0026026ADC|nr:LacI family DNA-binding transcriptional regulator [uncultured Georgenia sp.]HLT84639.1 LacI family DNA-binding transcriptional regulator [Phototrophicaceae bacterium]